MNIEELGINFGRKHIAKNGSFFRVARPTEAFWEYYRDHKDEVKAQGYSVYKDEKYGFCVYDWTETRKATPEEIEKYNKEKADYEKEQFDRSFNSFSIEVEESSYDEVEPCDTWDELRAEVERVCENPDVYWNECILPNKMPDFFWL